MPLLVYAGIGLAGLFGVGYAAKNSTEALKETDDILGKAIVAGAVFGGAYLYLKTKKK